MLVILVWSQIVTQRQDLRFTLIEPHMIDLGPSIQIPLETLHVLQQINTPTLDGICYFTEQRNPFIQVTDKDIKQDWPTY